MTFYYLFGFLPTLFFGSRFIIQWMASEKCKQCVAPPLFWRLSLMGNASLALHYYMQLQFPFLLIQALNGCIAWRNLDLIKPKPYSLKQALRRFSWVVLMVVSACLIAKMTFGKSTHWMDVPVSLLTPLTPPISLFWHLFGIFGGVLFASRFWVQWIVSEKRHASLFPRAFWIISILGSAVSLIYFLQIHDTVSMVNALFGLIPYLRNLILMRKRVVVLNRE